MKREKVFKVEGNKKPSVGIIGAGWVGQPLARTLVQTGHKVVVTTTSEDKLSILRETGAEAELLKLPLQEVDSGSASNKVFQQDVIVIAIPPQIKHGKTDYPDKIKHIVAHANQSKTSRIVMISTTAVYNGLAGDVEESSPLDYSAPKVEILSDAENAAMGFSSDSVVLRLAGLIGPKRHPARFINSPRLLVNGGVAVNLIHLDDVIGLILAAIKSDAACGIFNGVAETHLSKQEFYQAAARAAGESMPDFKSNDASEGSKVVLGDKAARELNFTLQHPDLIEWLATEKYTK